MTLVSYAQNFEDVLLWRALKDVKKGQYVDIGAHDPVIDSVSLAFYQSGWRGLHVEPTADYARRLREARPDEIVIEAAVSDAAGPIPFYELGGLSSGHLDIAKHHEESGHQPRATLVPTVGLDRLLEQLGGEIHWLKIDVEGMEADVLRSWRKSKIRPWILVVESTYPNSEKPTQHLWIDEVLQRGYNDIFFDGLSRYFVHETHVELADRLNRPANVFDSYQITPQHFSTKSMREQALSLAHENEVREARQAALLLEQRERIRAATIDLDNQNAALSALETRSAAEIEKARSEVEFSEIALAANSARLDELSVLQRESAAQIEKLKKDLRAEQEARVGLDNEILRVAELADPDLLNLRGLDSALRSVPTGSTFAAVQSRLQLASKELDLIRAYAERQYTVGHNARDAEISFLQGRISTLQIEGSDARKRLAQFEAAYVAARDRSEASGKANAQLRSSLDAQSEALDIIKADAAAVSVRLAAARAELASIHRSRGWRFFSLFGLLPKAIGVNSPSHNLRLSNDSTNPPQNNIPTHEHRTEIAVIDVRHVSTLLDLNGTTFVDALYRTFLKRSPDRAGREHFLGRLRAGHGKEAVLLAIATSTEAQAIGAPIDGVMELRKAQGRSRGWFSGRDRALDERLNRLEYITGEAHNQIFDRLDGIQNSVDQLQTAIGAGAGFKGGPGAVSKGAGNNVRQSIRQGISIAPPGSAPEFIESLTREVQSSSEAVSLRRG